MCTHTCPHTQSPDLQPQARETQEFEGEVTLTQLQSWDVPGQRACVDSPLFLSASQPVIFTTVTVMSHKAPDSIFKNDNSFWAFCTSQNTVTVLPVRLIFTTALEGGQGVIINPMSQMGKVRLQESGILQRFQHRLALTTTSWHFGTLACALPMVPSLLLCPAHCQAQIPARLLGTCLSLTELPQSPGKSGRPLAKLCTSGIF